MGYLSNKVLLAAIPLLASCQIGGGSVNEASHSLAFPRANLAFSVEGISYQGTAVVQRKVTQKIGVTIPKDAAKLIITTCHRQELIDKPQPGFVYSYIPASFLENEGSCLLFIEVITQKGNTQTGVIDFSASENLSAISYCNGKRTTSSLGVTFCQGRSGTVQKLWFDGYVKAKGSESCPELRQDGYAWEYELKPGECIYAFRSEDGKTHRLTTRGYTQFEVE